MKEKAGKAMHKPGMEAEGKVEQVKGKIKRRLANSRGSTATNNYQT